MHTQKPLDHFKTKTSKISKTLKSTKFKNFKNFKDYAWNGCKMIKKKG